MQYFVLPDLRQSFSPLVLRALALTLLVPALPVAAQGKLNPPLARPIGGDIQRIRLDSDGTRVVYLADQDTDEMFELYVVKPLGGPTVKLNAPLPAYADVRPDFEITADDAYVVFQADMVADQRFDLFRVPIDGGRPVQLNDPFGGGIRNVTSPGFALTPDGKQVVYRVPVAGSLQLFVVPLDQSSAPLQLTGPQPGGITTFRLSQDGERAFFQINGSTHHLFSVPLDGSALPVRLSANLIARGSVWSYEVSPDGVWVVYMADQDRPLQGKLFGVRSDGSAPAFELSRIPLSGSASNHFVSTFAISGSRVIYRAAQDRNIRVDLYSTPFNGSQPPVRLNPPLSSSGEVEVFTPAPDGSRVAFLVDGGALDDSLYSAPVDGSTPAVQLSAVQFQPLLYDYLAFSNDSTRVLFRSDHDAPGVVELFSTLADGSAPPVKLSPPMIPGGQVGRFFTLAGERVVFLADAKILGAVELYSAPVSGGPAVKLNPPLVFGGSVVEPSFEPDYRISRDGSRIAFLVDAEVDETVELYAARVDGSQPAVKLNHGLPIGPVEGDVTSYVSTPDGGTVVYRADQFTDEVFELLRVSTSGPRRFARLNGALPPGGDVSSFLLSPDGSRVVYLADQEANDVFELFSVLSDASQPPVRLNAPLAVGGDVQEGYIFTPDGTQVVYLADQDVDGEPELYSVPVDGGVPPIKLSGAPLVAGEILYFAVSPDSTRVAFIGDRLTAGLYELFSVPVDGSAAAIRISGPLPPSGGVLYPSVFDPEVLRFTSSGRVLFRADQVEGAHYHYELFSVPLDGSSPAVKLNGPVVGSFIVVGPPELTSDDLSVVFRADLSGQVLFRAPVDGSTPATLLTSALVGTGTEIEDGYRIAPGDARVVYRARVGTLGVRELFSVPLDASSAPVKLNGPLVTGGSVGGAQLGPDGVLVVYTANQDSLDLDLYVAPIDGSGPSRKLNRGAQKYVQPDFRFAPDGQSVVFRTQRARFVQELYRAPVTAPGAAQRVSPRGLRATTSFLLDARGRVVFADDGPRSVSEIYLAYLERVHGAAPTPGPFLVR